MDKTSTFEKYYEQDKYFMNLMKYYGQDKYFMDLMKYLNKGRNNNNNKNNFQTCRTVRDTLTVKNSAKSKVLIDIEFRRQEIFS